MIQLRIPSLLTTAGVRAKIRRFRSRLAMGSYWGPLVQEARFPYSLIRYNSSANTIRMAPFEFDLTPHRDEWFLNAYDDAMVLKEKAGVTFEMQASGAIRAKTPAFTVDVSTCEEIFILKEVLYTCDYHFKIPHRVLVLDIGMNVGISSLYFASVLGTDVLAYEPVPETYTLASDNFDLNPTCNARIERHNRGIGKSERQVQLAFEPSSRGKSSIYAREVHKSAVSVQLLDINDVVRYAKIHHPDSLIVAKIDCEGCEYEIIERLVSTGAVNDITYFMIEWHRFHEDHDPNLLTELLSNTGYITSLHGTACGAAGMLYATRLSSSQT